MNNIRSLYKITAPLVLLALTTTSPGLQASTCFAENQVPPSSAPNGFAMPDLQAEKDTYTKFGWTWPTSAEPNFTGDPTYGVSNPNIHGDTEADDLWTYTMMYERTKQQGYLDRATAWARYFKNDFRNCVGDPTRSFCYDKDNYNGDHMWGWGLVSWYQAMGDQAALTEAENLAATLEDMYNATGCLQRDACTGYGVRAAGRHLLIATRVAEVTGKQRWIDLRDKILNIILNSPDWDPVQGMYFRGEWSTDQIITAGSYAAGARIQSSMQLAMLVEAFDHAYRTTGKQELRDRMVAIARFVSQHGIDETYNYTGKTFGLVNGKTWHNYSANGPTDYWDPAYTSTMVNILMRGYRYTCETGFKEQAKFYYERGNKGIFGQSTARSAPDGVVDHFVDTVFSSATENFYFKFNKGELQYTYLLFTEGQDSNVVKPSPPVLK